MRPGAVLFDLDGTIYQGNALISGAAEILLLLKNAQIPYRFITNTTRMTKKNLSNMLVEMGLTLSIDDIITAPEAAKMYCLNKKYKRIQLIVQDIKMEEDFSEFQLVEHNPEAIILGDMGIKFSFMLINDLFNKMLGGSELVAMHKNRFWKSIDGYTMDVGGFVAALEYASGKSAAIMGKPNSNLFNMATHGWNLSPNEILMVGDDIEGDVRGASTAGMASVLVKTGKFKEGCQLGQNIKPDYIINTIADLPSILDLG